MPQSSDMGEFLGKREGLLGTRERLIRIAQDPQDLQGDQPTGDSQVSPIAEGKSAMLLRIVERHALFQMSARRQELANPQPRAALLKVRCNEQGWVPSLLSDAEQLVCQRARRLVLNPQGVIERQAVERCADLLPASSLLTEF